MLRSAGFAILRRGQPATAEQLTRSTGLDPARVRDALAAMVSAGAAELDDDGRVVATGGLSLVPTRHELVLDGVALHTWCAYDALGIPVAAGVDARARSRCAHCGKLIEIGFQTGQAQGGRDVITWFPDCTVTNARRDFCDNANLFCDHEHFDAWYDSAGRPHGEALTITEVAHRARINWAQDTRWPAPA
ncbi:MAG: organomercurial lyase [Acidimicrobiales bacterium]